MLELTSWVPRAASWTLREISLVAEPCSSIAAAIAVPIWSISPITLATFWIAVTVWSLAAWIAAICSEISVVAFAVCPASDLTSEATTAKPRPASPARAALVELLTDRGVHRRRSIEDVGGKPALGVHVARDVADRAHHFEPALRHRDLFHGLIFGSRHIDGEPAADGGKRDDDGGE